MDFSQIHGTNRRAKWEVGLYAIRRVHYETGHSSCYIFLAPDDRRKPVKDEDLEHFDEALQKVRDTSYQAAFDRLSKRYDSYYEANVWGRVTYDRPSLAPSPPNEKRIRRRQKVKLEIPLLTRPRIVIQEAEDVEDAVSSSSSTDTLNEAARYANSWSGARRKAAGPSLLLEDGKPRAMSAPSADNTRTLLAPPPLSRLRYASLGSDNDQGSSNDPRNVRVPSRHQVSLATQLVNAGGEEQSSSAAENGESSAGDSAPNVPDLSTTTAWTNISPNPGEGNSGAMRIFTGSSLHNHNTCLKSSPTFVMSNPLISAAAVKTYQTDTIEAKHLLRTNRYVGWEKQAGVRPGEAVHHHHFRPTPDNPIPFELQEEWRPPPPPRRKFGPEGEPLSPVLKPTPVVLQPRPAKISPRGAGHCKTIDEFYAEQIKEAVETSIDMPEDAVSPISIQEQIATGHGQPAKDDPRRMLVAAGAAPFYILTPWEQRRRATRAWSDRTDNESSRTPSPPTTGQTPIPTPTPSPPTTPTTQTTPTRRPPAPAAAEHALAGPSSAGGPAGAAPRPHPAGGRPPAARSRSSATASARTSRPPSSVKAGVYVPWTVDDARYVREQARKREERERTEQAVRRAARSAVRRQRVHFADGTKEADPSDSD